MSDRPIDRPIETHVDPLLAALRELPSFGVEGTGEDRLRRSARAAYVRRFEGSAWQTSAAVFFGKAAVPVFLAGIVGLYMTWAFAAATALVH
jgi:hypothetical protein